MPELQPEPLASVDDLLRLDVYDVDSVYVRAGSASRLTAENNAHHGVNVLTLRLDGMDLHRMLIPTPEIPGEAAS